MKYKHKLENLECRVAAWGRMAGKDQAAHKKPGSQTK